MMRTAFDHGDASGAPAEVLRRRPEQRCRGDWEPTPHAKPLTSIAKRESKAAAIEGSAYAGSPFHPRAVLQPELRQLRLVADVDDELDTSMLAREFPTIALERSVRSQPGDLVIDDFAWRGSFDFRPFDDVVEDARPVGSLAVRGSDAAGVAIEVMARYQRLVARRNLASTTPLFDAVLEAHASIFDAMPHVRHDLEHALDTWQWMLRIAPNIGLAPQIAALFHDIARLASPIYERLEHRVHRPLGDADPKQRGEVALAVLRGIGLAEEDVLRVRHLIGRSAAAEPDVAILDDAETLSFLSLMSSRYADYFGLAQTRRKVAFMMGRLGPVAREKVTFFRLRPDVHRLLMPG